MNSESIAAKKEPVMTRVVFIRLTIAAHIVIPLGFGFLGYLHVWERAALSWELVTIAILASLPFSLPLLALYIDNVSKNGLKLRDVPLSDTAEDPDIIRLQPAASRGEESQIRTLAASGARSLSPSARKVLRTLWHYQRQLPEHERNSKKRWGFLVQPSSPGHDDFRYGAEELIARSLATKNSRGIVYISSDGIIFCDKYGGDLGDGDIWSQFRPAS